MGCRVRPRSAGRGRGRPVGADSAETRARILRAAREVINERGYYAATFQAISERADLSRPTMHYYFHTREQLYNSLMQEAAALVADCITEARREDTLLKQLTTFVAAAHRLEFADRSMMRFILTSRLESHRHADLRNGSSTALSAIGVFYTSMVDDAIKRRELPDDTEAAAVVGMLLAMFWGVGFYAGFVNDADDMIEIAKQLRSLFVRGLLDEARSTRSLTIDPHAPAAVAAEAFGRTWPGLRLVIDVPSGQPFISADGAQPVMVTGDFTRERVRSVLYRAYRVESFVGGIARYDTLDAAVRPN